MAAQTTDILNVLPYKHPEDRDSFNDSTVLRRTSDLAWLSINSVPGEAADWHIEKPVTSMWWRRSLVCSGQRQVYKSLHARTPYPKEYVVSN